MSETIARNKVQELLTNHNANRFKPDIDGKEVWILEDGSTIVQFPSGFGRVHVVRVEDIFYLLGLSSYDFDYFLS